MKNLKTNFFYLLVSLIKLDKQSCQVNHFQKINNFTGSLHSFNDTRRIPNYQTQNWSENIKLLNRHLIFIAMLQTFYILALLKHLYCCLSDGKSFRNIQDILRNVHINLLLCLDITLISFLSSSSFHSIHFSSCRRNTFTETYFTIQQWNNVNKFLFRDAKNATSYRANRIFLLFVVGVTLVMEISILSCISGLLIIVYLIELFLN